MSETSRYFCCRVGGKVDRSYGAAVQCPVCDVEFFYELALLGEDLNAVAPAIADVDETVAREADAVDRISELLGPRAVRVMRRGRVIVNLIERFAVSSPAALESSSIGIPHDDSLIHITVRDVDFVGIFVEVGAGGLSRENRRLIVLGLWIDRLRLGFSKPGKEFPVVVVAEKAARSSQPDDSFFVDDERVRPAPMRIGVQAAPGFQKISFGVKFQDRGRAHAAFRGWRVQGSIIFSRVRIEIGRALQYPDVIVLVDVHSTHVFKCPFVRQRQFGP